jgi:hypothetical protein
MVQSGRRSIPMWELADILTAVCTGSGQVTGRAIEMKVMAQLDTKSSSVCVG